MSRRRAWIIVPCVVTLTAGLLWWQGWRRSFTGIEYDQVVNIDEASRLIADLRLPRVGALASLGAYNPPGTAWLMAPGIVTGERRCYERVGASLVGVLTLVGLWLLARAVADQRTAALVVAVFAFSALGMFYGSSLWPRAKPCAFVWMTYFTLLWARRREARWLAASLVVYGVGLFVFLEMLPAILAVPLVWARFRPRVRVSWLLAALLASLAVWWPYLSFEASRGFRDLKSQVLLRGVGPDIRSGLALYGDRILEWDAQRGSLGPLRAASEGGVERTWRDAAKFAFFRAYYFARNLTATILHLNPLGVIVLPIFALPLIAWLSHSARWSQRLRASRRATWLGVLCIATAAAGNHVVAGAILGRRLDAGEAAKIILLQLVTLACGAALIARKRTSRLLLRLDRRWNPAPAGGEANPSLQVVLLCFIGPWLAVALLATNAKYGWWVWGVQVVLLGAFASYVPRRNGWPEWAVRLVEVLLVVGVVFNNVVLERLADWRQHGFAGVDAPLARAADFVAHQIESQPRAPRHTIGYHLFFNGYELLDHDLDARYRIGAPIDQYLEIAYEFTNAGRTAEGFGSADAYRIVETAPRPAKTFRFAFNGDGFEMIKQFDDIQVWKRK